jgi:hypothetical protein
MSTLLVLLVLAVSLVAVGAFRVGGLRWLWLLCALTLLAVVLLSLVLSAVYSVPSAWLVNPRCRFSGGASPVAEVGCRSDS